MFMPFKIKWYSLISESADLRVWERNTRERQYVMGLYHIKLPGNLPLRGFALAVVSHLAARILAIEGRSTSDYLLGRGCCCAAPWTRWRHWPASSSLVWVLWKWKPETWQVFLLDEALPVTGVVISEIFVILSDWLIPGADIDYQPYNCQSYS